MNGEEQSSPATPDQNVREASDIFSALVTALGELQALSGSTTSATFGAAETAEQLSRAAHEALKQWNRWQSVQPAEAGARFLVKKVTRRVPSLPDPIPEETEQ